MSEQTEEEGRGRDSGSDDGDAATGPQVGTRYSADEIHENILKAANEELERPFSQLALSGLAAGLGLGFSFLGVALVSSWLSVANRPIAQAIAYPVGFIYVVLARHQLFTENTLEPVLPLLERPTATTLRRVARLWSIVLAANLAGAALVALAVAKTEVLDPEPRRLLVNLARAATSGGALIVFYKAIWAGWLIALMAWLLASTRDTTAQIVLIWITTAPIAALGFKHSIAGAVEAFYLVWTGDATLMAVLRSFELPAIAGNVVGGVVLVALLNHGQTAPTRTEASSPSDHG